jgi:hypothetical protein
MAPPLVLACLTGKPSVVKALIDAGAHRDACDATFSHPLHAACLWFGQRHDNPGTAVRIVNLLLDGGPEPHIKHCPFGSALIAATYSLLPEVVEVLLQRVNAEPGTSVHVPVVQKRDFTAWDALEQWPERITEDFRRAFTKLQTDWFGCGQLRNAAANQERRDRIRGLFLQYGGPRQIPRHPSTPSMYPSVSFTSGSPTSEAEPGEHRSNRQPSSARDSFEGLLPEHSSSTNQTPLDSSLAHTFESDSPEAYEMVSLILQQHRDSEDGAGRGGSGDVPRNNRLTPALTW